MRSDWQEIAMRMREEGVDELAFHADGSVASLRLGGFVPSPPTEDDQPEPTATRDPSQQRREVMRRMMGGLRRRDADS